MSDTRDSCYALEHALELEVELKDFYHRERDFYKRQYEIVSGWHQEKLWMLYIIAWNLGLRPADLPDIGDPDVALKFAMRIQAALDAAIWSRG